MNRKYPKLIQRVHNRGDLKGKERGLHAPKQLQTSGLREHTSQASRKDYSHQAGQGSRRTQPTPIELDGRKEEEIYLISTRPPHLMRISSLEQQKGLHYLNAKLRYQWSI